jgi:hypothetical protein
MADESTSKEPRDDERRVHPRYSADFDVVFASELQELGGATGDISLGGASIVTYRVLPIRTPIRVTLQLPSGPLSLQAQVRWVKSAPKGQMSKMGVVWLSVGDGERAVLDQAFREAANDHMLSGEYRRR